MCDSGGGRGGRGGRGRKRKSYGPDGFEKWGGYMGAKIAKLQGQYSTELASHDATSSNIKGIFDGIAIFVNGYTEPTGEELKRIMMSNGGIYHHYHSRSQTTHIIASNLPDSKIKNLNTDRIVSPKWIVDSLEAGRLLDYTKYLLYTRQSRSQPKISFKKSYYEELSAVVDNDQPTLEFENIKKENITMEIENDFTSNIIEESSESKDNFISRNILENKILNIKSEVTSSLSSEKFENTVASSLHFNESDHQSPTKEYKMSNAMGKIGNTSANYSHLDKPSNQSPSKEHTMSTANPNFLSEFYNNSRLHHISTMGAAFKQYVNEMQKKNDGFPGRENLKEWLKTKKIESIEDDGMKQVTRKRNNKTIMHVDMDCFFVSVGLRNHPELCGKPVAVTHAKGNSSAQSHPNRDRSYELKYYQERELNKIKSKLPSENQTTLNISSGDVDMFEDDDEIQLKINTNIDTDDDLDKKLLEKHQQYSSFSLIDEQSSMSEIASCSYEARKMGVKNGMFLGPALKLCPNLKTIPYDFEGYKEVSYKLYDIVGSYTHDIEAVSCDEMFVDLSSVLLECGASPLEFASCIREQIKVATGCPCSAGLSNSILGARMATKKAKPNGQFFLPQDELSDYMKDQLVRDLPGVGRSLSTRLEVLGVSECGQIQTWTLGRLQSEFGSRTGLSLFNFCRGIDDRSVKTEHLRKSVSAEVNYGIRFTCQADAVSFIEKLSTEVASRLSAINQMGKCITLKLKVRAKDAPVEPSKFMGHGVCDNVAKSISLNSPTASAALIQKHIIALMQQVKSPIQDYRGVGIQVSKLEGLKESYIKTGTSSIKSFLSSKPAIQKKSCEQNTKSELAWNKSNGDRDMLDKPVQQRNSSKRDATFNNNNERSSLVKYQSDIQRNARSSYRDDKEPVVKESKPSIDMDVLMALPPDIQQQVINEYKQQGFNLKIPLEAAKTPQRSTKPEEKSFSDENKQLNISKLSAHPIKSLGEERGSVRTPFKRNDYDTEQENNLPGPSGYNPRNKTNYSRNNIEDDMNTSISQIDSSFLAALPKDIREEIRANSHQHRKTRSKTVDQEDLETSDITSFSQVDSSFLDALPDDMKEELQQEMNRQNKKSNPASQKQLILKSPTKKQASKKGKRGRPSKTDPRYNKNNKSTSDKKTFISNDGRQSNDQSLKILKNSQNTAIKTKIINQDHQPNRNLNEILEVSDANINVDLSNKSEKIQNEEPVIPDEVNDLRKEPSLCGVEDVLDIKRLICEWVSSCPGPEKEDIDILVNFYTSLIEHRDLEKVDLLIKFLFKNINKTYNKYWEEAYTTIMEHIQMSMLDKYSIKLKVRDSFR